MIKITLGRLGGDTHQLHVPAGTTVKDMVKAHDLGTSAIRMRGKPVRLSARLKDGDTIIALPRLIIGAADDRYDHLDLEKCRRTMSDEDYNFFVNYVGAEAFGFRDEDLNPI